MAEKITWLGLDPVDTLTFRGAESMVAGESHEVSTLFPPLPSTLIGAVRTALLRQKKIDPYDYLAEPKKYAELYPLLGIPEKPGFKLVGPVFRLQDEVFLPAPAHWFREKNDKLKEISTVRVQAAQPLSAACHDFGLCGSVENPFWVHDPVAAALEPLHGYWVSAAGFAVAAKSAKTFNLDLLSEPEAMVAGAAAIIHCRHLYDPEARFGIALQEGTRRVKEGHLFSSQHIRLKSGVQLVVGIVAPSVDDLAAQGILQLGGEQRVCGYNKIDHLTMPENRMGNLIMTLSPVPVTALPKDFFARSWAGGKLLRVGGWDMQKGFHKDMVTCYPAGTVFQVSEDSVLATGFIRL